MQEELSSWLVQKPFSPTSNVCIFSLLAESFALNGEQVACCLNLRLPSPWRLCWICCAGPHYGMTVSLARGFLVSPVHVCPYTVPDTSREAKNIGWEVGKFRRAATGWQSFLRSVLLHSAETVPADACAPIHHINHTCADLHGPAPSWLKLRPPPALRMLGVGEAYTDFSL